MQWDRHKKLTPNPSDPKLNLVRKVLEEQHKIMSRLPKKYWLKLGSKIPGLEAMQSMLQAMQYAIFDTFLKCQTKVQKGENDILVVLNTFWKRSKKNRGVNPPPRKPTHEKHCLVLPLHLLIFNHVDWRFNIWRP